MYTVKGRRIMLGNHMFCECLTEKDAVAIAAELNAKVLRTQKAKRARLILVDEE